MTVDYDCWLTQTQDRPTLPSERAPSHGQDSNCQTVNKNLVMSPRRGSTPRQADWLAVSCNVTLTLTLTEQWERDTCILWQSTYYYRLTLPHDPRPLDREDAPNGQDNNCQTVTNIRSWAPDGARYQDRQTDWPSVVMWLWLWLWLTLRAVNS
jgi:hypothetical protein